MTIGYLGIGKTKKDIVFKVSSKTVETFQNMKVTKQASYTTHKVHGHKAVPEMTGVDADTITFDMILSAFLNVNPQKELEKLKKFLTKGTVCTLVLGDKPFGDYVVKSMPYTVDYVLNDGKIAQAKVSVSLIEAGGKT